MEELAQVSFLSCLQQKIRLKDSLKCSWLPSLSSLRPPQTPHQSGMFASLSLSFFILFRHLC